MRYDTSVSTETEQIKERINIKDIVSEYVSLKQAGQNMKGLCPFHQEKSPSFIVSPNRNTWHCFGCFPPGEKVKTPFGYHDIETVDKGHYVVSGKGEIRSVLATQHRDYEGDLITMRLHKLTYPVTLTQDHNVFVIRGALSTRLYKVFARRYRDYLNILSIKGLAAYTKKVEKYFPKKKIPAGEIQKGDLLMYPIDEIVEEIDTLNLEDYLDRKSNLGSKPKTIPLQIPVSDDFLKLCGYYVAEGSSHRAYIRFSLGNHELDFAEEICEIIERIFGLKVSIHIRSGERTGVEVTACHSQLAIIFKNLMGKDAASKHFPFIFQRLSAKQQKVLLDAYHRGDGTNFTANRSNKPHKSVTSVSQIVSEQVTDFLLRNSIFPTVSIARAKVDSKSVNHQKSFTVSWSEVAKSKYNLIYHSDGIKYWLLPILSIERKPYRGPVYNLTVDEDHSYVATSFAVANCGEGGDVFSFIQKIEGLDFPGALKMLAERAGVQLKTHSPASSNRRQRLFDLLSLSAKLYHEILMRQAPGKKAQEYLTQRGVRPETMALFQIGYAPDSWDLLQKWLKKHNFTEEEMIASGMIGRSARGKLFDRFRGRIMFPITDTQGRIVAFGGRIVPWHETGNEGKYVNSPETALYEKRRTVYNLANAKKGLRQNQPCLVVEGYMDVVMLVQAGVENVVATSGTAFTDDHIKQLSRFTNMLHFAFDADTAGWKATVAATHAALASGMKVATVVLPAGKDPADLVVSSTTDEVKVAMSNTRSLIAVLLDQLKSSSSSISQEDQLAALLPLVRDVRNPILQGAMVQDVSDILHIPEVRVLDMVAEAPRIAPAQVQEAQVVAQVSPEVSRHVLSEHQLLGLAILDLGVRQTIFPHLQEDFLLDPSSQKLYNFLQRMSAREESFFSLSTRDLIGALDAELIALAEAIRTRGEELLETTSNTPIQEGRLLLRSLQRRSLKNRLLKMQQELTRPGDRDRAAALKQFQALAEELARIDS